MSPTKSHFVSQFSAQMGVVGALILRDLHTRFGRDNIGYLWLIAEPLLFATVIGIIHASEGGHVINGINPVPLSLLGYTLFIVFRGIFGKAETLLESNLPLLYHRQISILNLSFARAVMESTGCFCAMVITISAAIALGFSSLPARPLYIIFAWFLYTWLSFGMSLCVIALTFERPTLGRLTHPFSYFMMPLSGAFFALSWTPIEIQKALQWNPMVPIFEIARYGMFENGSTEFLDAGYAATWCAVLTYIGLLSTRRMKSRIHMS